jgi:hypothetical protein
VQLKLDQLVQALQGAQNPFINPEGLEEEDLDRFGLGILRSRKEFARLSSRGPTREFPNNPGKSLLDGVRRHVVSSVHGAANRIFDVLFRLTTCLTHFL